MRDLWCGRENSGIASNDWSNAVERLKLRFVVLLWTLLVTCLVAPDSALAVDPCRRENVANRPFIICQVDATKTTLSVRWQDESGTPFGSLSAMKREADARGEHVIFAMNGGMYHQDLSPVGYFVENRKRLKKANTRPGPGNFHLLPNGIFYVDGKSVGVMETRAFLQRNRRPQFATQSGPMLIINGRLHPKFRHNSQSRKIRNGVGVKAGGRIAYFVLSEEPVTFYTFAKVFERHLKTPNALFLDGSISQLISTSVDRRRPWPVGPIIVGTTRP